MIPVVSLGFIDSQVYFSITICSVKIDMDFFDIDLYQSHDWLDLASGKSKRLTFAKGHSIYSDTESIDGMDKRINFNNDNFTINVPLDVCSDAFRLVAQHIVMNRFNELF